MSPYQTVCQLCGVSFAIARLRRADEPEDAAWSYYGHDLFETVDGVFELCGGNSGCSTHGEGVRAREHIAGPGCVSESGYSGYRISLEEMKGCRAIQCLVLKHTSWWPEDDDEDFEVEGRHFLTGIGDGSPGSELLENIDPVRHDTANILVANLEGKPPLDVGLPFHPTCFEMYKKICQMRIGKVDTEGLYIWRRLDCDFNTFFIKFPRDPAVRSANQQFWSHEPGREYLAANPINIPGLPQLLQSHENHAHSRTTFGDTEGPQYSGQSMESTVLPTPNAAKDPFSPLSAEITSMILDHLGSKDIANLRLATPVFRQLPTIMFRRLLLEDMPWFFEVKDLDVAKYDWYEFYCALKSSWKDLKGVRNRRRIWRDLEEILRRIDEFRKEGKIAPVRGSRGYRDWGSAERAEPSAVKLFWKSLSCSDWGGD